MTDKQIQQNAEEYILPLKTLPGADENITFIAAIREAFIAGAHSRDEEIEHYSRIASVYKIDAQDTAAECERLHDIIDQLRNDNKDIEQALACAEDVVDIQRKELKQLRNPWISVKDRLPDDMKPIIVYASNGEVYNAFMCDNLWCNVPETDEITHWMPIPEAPLNK